MTMATIVNSDMIPFRKRGMYQALQNCIYGFGAIAGASFGGSIADHIGWRWCFLLQVPVSVLALAVGYFVIKNPAITFSIGDDFGAVWKKGMSLDHCSWSLLCLCSLWGSAWGATNCHGVAHG